MATDNEASAELPGLLLEAGGEASRPGILLLQEIFGLNASMRLIATAWRNSGYDVFAPDLFWRQQPGVELDPASAEDRERAQALMQGLDERLAIADIAAGVAMLRGRGRSSGRVAAVGYCLGGRLAYVSAAAGVVDAAISYYGVAIHRSLDLAGQVKVPLLIHVAGEDHLCDAEAQRELYEAFAFRPNVTLHTHRGVGHAFARPASPHWNETAAETANEMSLAYLRSSIGTGDDRR
ncbi:dienelactone hydrolase family protein [Sphingomonas sp.]|uniref:dienelactone hydrolase family protein n=1 Tax=Sphingomonas sp. TaxID=28214 RepID=UPI0025D8772E|nr:dienelactone hydrolase family protein [Sphingomonas sp.]